MDQLEIHVIDQFINGLGHHELQKHVQFRHPRTLHEPIGLATEYEALEGSIDRVKKPQNEETTVAPISLNSSNENKPLANVTLEQISKLIDTKLDGILPRNETETKILRRAETLLSQGKLKMTKIITHKLKPVHEAQHMFHTEHIVHIANVRVTPSKTVTFVTAMAGMQVAKIGLCNYF